MRYYKLYEDMIPMLDRNFDKDENFIDEFKTENVNKNILY